jgi:thioredoxin reductase
MPYALSHNEREYEINASCPAHQLHQVGVRYVQAKVESIEQQQGGQGPAGNNNGEGFLVNLDSNSPPIKASIVVACSGFDVGVIKPRIGQSFGDRKTELEAYRTAISKAKNVVIAGGGSVAVDLGGQVRDMLSEGATLHHVVSDTKFLTSRHSQAERTLVTNYIESLPNTKVVYQDRINVTEPSIVKTTYQLTNSRSSLEADVYLPAFAVWRAGYLPAEALDKGGAVDVDSTTLMCKKVSRLFAIACSNNGEMSAIPKIEGQVKSVVKNIELLSFDKSPSFKHVEALPFLKSEAAILYGKSWAMIATDSIGFLGPLCVCIGFPFPCCLMPCLPHCGLCGTSCAKPVGKEPAQFFGVMMEKPFGPVLGAADKKAPVPEGEMGR